MSETNSYKKATLELSPIEIVELKQACLGRVGKLRTLLSSTCDIESRDMLNERLEHMLALHDRLSGLQ
jgi:hypothetical protein